MSDKPSFFSELKRRNVYKVAVAYAVVSWLLVQITTQVFPFFDIPNWVVRLVVLLTIVGFPVSLVCAWPFEMTPEGMSDAQWEPRKIALRSFGQYLQGVIYAAAEKWSDADVQLRASLPGIQRPQSKAEALYYLGLANYRLAEKGQAERAPDALLFSRQSADIPSSFQQMARKNAEAIRTKFQIQ